MLSVFRLDSPYELKRWKKYESLWKVMEKIYSSDQIEERIGDIYVPADAADTLSLSGVTDSDISRFPPKLSPNYQPTYYEVLFDGKYARATWFGIGFACFQ